jgi:4-amino-4-deoxy-L-arabinose transferase-like glycosyltransferase
MAIGDHWVDRLGAGLDSVAGKVAVGFACLYALLGLMFIPYTGIETDEAVFALPLYGPLNGSQGITVFHRHVPLMLFPYGGALKTLIYWPILRVFGPNAYAIRLPVVILGAVTIVLLFKLAERMASRRVALLASLLLATDASFLLTNTYDWGPVALQQILLVTGCLAIGLRRPVLGCFIVGVALWNKAIFVWALTGLVAAVIIAYLPEVRSILASRRTVVRCACAFIAGALPLIVYNVHAPNATLHANVHLSTENFHAKLISLKNTLNGSDLFGIVVAPETEEMPKSPRSVIARLSCWIRDRLGPRYSSLFVYAILFAFLSGPLWWRSSGRRAAVFAIVFLFVAFLAMAVVRYTGSAHHIVLLYPMPHLLVALAVVALRPKWLAVAAGTALIVANLLVVNQYVAQFERNGSYGLFTDALYPLSDSLAGSEGRTAYALDFGMEDNLTLLHEGRLSVKRAWPIESVSDGEIAAMLADAGAVFVNHVPSREYFKGGDVRFEAVAKANGYERRNIQTIPDSNGRPQFELFRFERVR